MTPDPSTPLPLPAPQADDDDDDDTIRMDKKKRLSPIIIENHTLHDLDMHHLDMKKNTVP